MRTLINFALVVLAGCVAGAIIYRITQPSDVYSEGSVNFAASEGPNDNVVYRIEVGDSPVRGNADAKVTLVEFGDFECPICADAQDRVINLYKRKLGPELRIAYKHLPRPMHEHAELAARAAVAAQKQGRFWEMHDALFAAFRVDGVRALSPSGLESIAGKIGLNTNQWKADLSESSTLAIIEADKALALKLGATRVPAFFVNGVRIVGIQSDDRLLSVLKERLSAADQALSRGVARSSLYSTLIADGKERGHDKAAACALPSGSSNEAVDPGPSKERFSINLHGAPAIGPNNAPVTVVEFADFECPFCKSEEPMLAKLRHEYPESVRLVWKARPLSFHQNATLAAEAGAAAHAQGNFWGMHDAIFNRDEPLSREAVKRLASSASLDVDRLDRDLDTHAFASVVASDVAEADKVGATGTPTFFVNGRRLVGAVPYDVLRDLVDEELKVATNQK